MNWAKGVTASALDACHYRDLHGRDGAAPRLMAIELVIFDCDGVLIDSEPLAVRIDMAMLAEVGLPMCEAEVIERFVGRSSEVTDDAIEAHLGHRPPHGCVQRFEQFRRDAF